MSVDRPKSGPCEFVLDDLSVCGKDATERHACCYQWICEEHCDRHADYCYCETCS